MAAIASGPRRLSDLLIEPRETLGVELKGWLDLTNNGEHKALLAKSIIALANHGGGFILIGLTRTEIGSGPAADRPVSLAAYNPDTVNSIVARYCEPTFHCDVAIETGPDALGYPVVNVPGGHKVPIRATRDGPNGEVIKRNSYYIRRAGPCSEIPQSGQEWDELIRRVVSNAREELVDQFRAILSGGAVTQSTPSQTAEAESWFDASLLRWQEVVAELPAGHAARMEPGHFAVGYTLAGDFTRPSLGELKEKIRRATVRHTGWPEFWVPTRREIEAYPRDGMVECWIGRDGEARDGAHADFWRASPEGQMFLIRGHQEDGDDVRIAPGTGFEITLPTWRLGEAFLHASAMAAQLGDPRAEVTLVVEWTGLKGRNLIAHPSTNRMMHGTYRSLQGSYRARSSVRADEIPMVLPELVGPVLAGLYELFDFFQLPPTLVAEELAKMRQNRL